MQTCMSDVRSRRCNPTVILAVSNLEAILRNLHKSDLNTVQYSSETVAKTAITKTETATDDLTRETTDPFLNLMIEEKDTKDVPTKNTTEAQATNVDYQPPAKERSMPGSTTDSNGTTTSSWALFSIPWRKSSVTPQRWWRTTSPMSNPHKENFTGYYI